MLNQCQVCLSEKITYFDINFPFFRHYDHGIFSVSNNKIGLCEKCGMVFRNIENNDKSLITDIYSSDEYRNKMKSDHVVFTKDNSKFVTPYFLQVEIIREYFFHNNPSVLDIGCHDGSFLFEFSRSFPDGNFTGYDISDNTCGKFPKGKNFNYTNNLSNLQRKYDLIILSQSMQYIYDIEWLRNELKRLLKPYGMLFMHAPDFIKKPCTLLFGDLFYHHSSYNIVNLINSFKLQIVLNGHVHFGKDLVILCQNSKDFNNKDCNTLAKHNYASDLEYSVQYLNTFKLKINSIKLKHLFVLGTTIEAALVNFLISDKIEGYIDENLNKDQLQFQNKEVRHLKFLKDNATLIVPYGLSGETIVKRIEKTRKLKYILV